MKIDIKIKFIFGVDIMKDEYPRLPTEEEKGILSDHCLNEDNWLVAFRTKREIDFISKRSRMRRIIYLDE